MSFGSDFGFRKSLESSNPYIAVKDVASQARKLAKSCNCKILDSEAVSSIVQGDAVDIVNKYADYNSEFEAKYISEMFCYVEDKEVCDAVYDSYYESKSQKNLVYIYNSITNADKMARVRILTRILWNKLYCGDD